MKTKHLLVAGSSVLTFATLAMSTSPVAALYPLGPKRVTTAVTPAALAPGGFGTITVRVESIQKIEEPPHLDRTEYVPLPGEYISFFCSTVNPAFPAHNLDTQETVANPVKNTSCANLGVTFLSAADLNLPYTPAPGGFTSTGDGFTGPTGTYTTVVSVAGNATPKDVWITARSCNNPPALPNGPEGLLGATTCEAGPAVMLTIT